MLVLVAAVALRNGCVRVRGLGALCAWIGPRVTCGSCEVTSKSRTTKEERLQNFRPAEAAQAASGASAASAAAVTGAMDPTPLQGPPARSFRLQMQHAVWRDAIGGWEFETRERRLACPPTLPEFHTLVERRHGLLPGSVRHCSASCIVYAGGW